MKLGFESFKEAENAFRRFLSTRGVNANVQWVFREDVALCRGCYLIRLPKPWEPSNRQFAMKQFYLHRANSQNSGFKCFAQDARFSACYISESTSQNASQHVFQNSNVQFGCPDFLANLTVVSNLLKWKIHKRRSDPRVTSLPFRKSIRDAELPPNVIPISRPKMLCTVADCFELRGRGIVVVANETSARIHAQFNEDFPYRVGDRIELRRPDGSNISTLLQSIHSVSKASQNPSRFIRYPEFSFARDVELSDVPMGTEVWIVAQNTGQTPIDGFNKA